ncbi:MAG: hypothetical protein WCX60_06595 [Anaerovoracaceae bacterium]
MEYKTVKSRTFKEKNSFVELLNKIFFEGKLVKDEFLSLESMKNVPLLKKEPIELMNKIEYHISPKYDYFKDYSFLNIKSYKNHVPDIELFNNKAIIENSSSSVFFDKIRRILITTYNNNTEFYRIKIDYEEDQKFQFYGKIGFYDFNYYDGGKKRLILNLTPHDANNEKIILIFQKTMSKSETQKINTNEKKENKMKDKFNSLMPQRVSDGIAMAMNGKIAVKVGDNNYVSYNSSTKQIEDHMDFTFGEDRISEFCFLMPVELKTLKEGDIVSTNNGYGFVTEVDSESGDVTCVSAADATKADLVPVKNVFTNTTMVKKLITMFDNVDTQAGGINPMMFMLMGRDRGDKSGSDDMIKMLLMSQMIGKDFQAGGINPMMFMMM